MKILFVCENYIPHYGGVEVVFKNLAERYLKKGHKVSLVTHLLIGTKKREKINGVDVHRIPSLHSRYLFTFLSIPRSIKLARKHDIIQTTTFNGAFPAWLAGKITGKPVVLAVHEVWVNKWDKVTSFSSWKCKIHNFLEKSIYLLPFDKYICVSESTKKDLLAIGINKRKVKRIYNGLEYEFWNPGNFDDKNPEEIINKFKLNNKFVYFSWGRPGESKGHEYVIRAVPQIKKSIPDSKFVLMLSTADKYRNKYKQLVRLVKNLKLEDDILLIPPVPHLELGYYLKAFDCAVIPSVYEGFGYNATEAITMGIPVVVSNAGSLPEVVSGKYLMFENRNVQDLANKVIQIHRGKHKDEPIKKFEWDASIEKYLEIYRELLSKRNISEKLENA